MKTQKQVEAIENMLIDTIAKLAEDGHQEIHVLETMLGFWAQTLEISGTQ